jgi:hypothetical protein
MAKGKKKTTVHKKIREDARPSGKSLKKHPKIFSVAKRRLVPAVYKVRGRGDIELVDKSSL